MIVLDQTLITLLESWIWPFFRVAGLLMAAPVIGTRSVPVRIRLVIAIAITLAIVPVLPVTAYIEPFTGPWLLTSIQQVIIGTAMGLTIRTIFVTLEIAGQAIGQLMGLMMASMVDPQNGNQVPVIGQFYLLLATLLFLSVDGHLLMIAALVNSFQHLPIGVDGLTRDAAWEIINWLGTILSTSILIALPAMASLLIVNLAFGVMTRAAPQLNIFAVGFPIMIILGVFIVMFTLDGFIPHMISLFDQAFDMLDRLVGI
ncbi:MAG: flagellar biosynthetic protein FliR [Planctomycetota bacterium]